MLYLRFSFTRPIQPCSLLSFILRVEQIVFFRVLSFATDACALRKDSMKREYFIWVYMDGFIRVQSSLEVLSMELQPKQLRGVRRKPWKKNVDSVCFYGLAAASISAIQQI